MKTNSPRPTLDTNLVIVRFLGNSGINRMFIIQCAIDIWKREIACETFTANNVVICIRYSCRHRCTITCCSTINQFGVHRLAVPPLRGTVFHAQSHGRIFPFPCMPRVRDAHSASYGWICTIGKMVLPNTAGITAQDQHHAIFARSIDSIGTRYCVPAAVHRLVAIRIRTRSGISPKPYPAGAFPANPAPTAAASAALPGVDKVWSVSKVSAALMACCASSDSAV